MKNKLPYPEHLARSYPPGKKPDRRRIIRCSRPGVWYENKVGEIITVHYFCTFGAYDISGKRIDFYDLSAPIHQRSKLQIIGYYTMIVIIAIIMTLFIIKIMK